MCLCTFEQKPCSGCRENHTNVKYDATWRIRIKCPEFQSWLTERYTRTLRQLLYAAMSYGFCCRSFTPSRRLYFFAFVRLSVSRITQKVIDKFWLIFLWLAGCVTCSKRLDFGDDRHDEAGAGIFEWNCYHCEIGQFYEFILRILRDQLPWRWFDVSERFYFVLLSRTLPSVCTYDSSGAIRVWHSGSSAPESRRYVSEKTAGTACGYRTRFSATRRKRNSTTWPSTTDWWTSNLTVNCGTSSSKCVSSSRALVRDLNIFTSSVGIGADFQYTD